MNEMEKINQIIEERISKLIAERTALDSAHREMVRMNQQLNQEFQQRVVQSQTRFAQITGAIDELSKLKNGQEPSAENQQQEKPTP